MNITELLKENFPDCNVEELDDYWKIASNSKTFSVSRDAIEHLILTGAFNDWANEWKKRMEGENE